MNENEQLIEEMMREAERAAEPGTLKVKDVVSRGDEEMPAPMMASELSSAGWVYIYDTVTRESSLCNRNMLPQALQLKRANGAPFFTTVKPKEPPARGTFKCMLHPDGPNRAHYDQLGLPTCRKSNLTSPFQVRRHMEKRHRQEWATIEQERVQAERDEERAFQRAMIEGVKGKAIGTPEAPLYVSDKPKKVKK